MYLIALINVMQIVLGTKAKVREHTMI